MDQKTYTYALLQTKYKNFTSPGFEIKVDGKSLAAEKFHISSVEVEISAGGTAGGCTFTIDGQYDYKTSKWKENATKVIKPGAKLVVNGGYETKKELFYGYIDDYAIEFGRDGPPRIVVNGLDGLGYLMNMCEPIYAGKKKPKQIVQMILQKSQAAGFAKSVKVGALTGFETPIIKEQVDDWKFLTMMAQRYGASLFAVDGELIFDKVITKTSPILTLTIGKNVKSFTKRVSLAHQIGKVEVLGRDVNQKPVKGEASRVTAGGSGKSAAEWVRGLKDSVLRERTEFAQTQEECKTLAENRLNSIAMGFVSGEGECVGIPELIPGRYIKIDGADDATNGSYFLTKVVHRINSEQYITSFEVKGAKT